jgi:zinc protease
MTRRWRLHLGKDGANDVLNDLFSYGTKTLDRLAFQKALDDIAADESAGYSFSLDVLKQDFSRRMQLLADNELNPALPDDAFMVIKPQTAQFIAGQMKSPGYATERALTTALLPANDPGLRQATPQTVSSLKLDDVKDYYAKTLRPDLTTIVVIGDVTPAEARTVVEKWFDGWKASGDKPQVDPPPVPPNKASAANVPDPSQLQDTVTLSEMIPINRFDPDYYPLQMANHVLGGGFYATRLYHDLREVAGYVYNVDVCTSLLLLSWHRSEIEQMAIVGTVGRRTALNTATWPLAGDPRPVAKNLRQNYTQRMSSEPGGSRLRDHL